MRGSSTDFNAPPGGPQQLEELISRFESAWKQAPGPEVDVDLASFLPPPADPLRSVALHVLIVTDLNARWDRGQHVGLGFYLDRFPELGGPQALPAELVYEEYRVRSNHGDSLRLDHYRDCFPNQYARLLELIQDDSGSLSVVEDSTMDSLSTPPLPPSLPPLLQSIAPPTVAPSLPIPPPQPAQAEAPALHFTGQYRLLLRIGSGTFGEVWKAEAPGGAEVAVKIIARPVEHAEAKQELKALEQVKRLRHPYLVQTHAFWISGDRLYIVLDLADCSLLDRVNHCREQGLPGLPLPELLRYFREAAEALDFLHAERVHHRDIKPANLLLVKGHIKVADLGLARTLQSQLMLTEATMGGTPAYMPPEVWEGQVSPHSDQYSLAVTYAELRLQHRLFRARNLMLLMREVCFNKPDLTGLTDREQEVLLRALDHNPHARYPSCKDFVQALEEAFQPPAPPPPPPPAARSRGRLAIGLLALLLALGLFGAYRAAVGRKGPGEASPQPRITLRSVSFLALGMGQKARLPLHVERHDFRGPVRVSCPQLPPRVLVRAGELADNADEVSLELEAARDASPATHHITVRAEGGGVAGETALELTVLFLPPDFQPDGDQVVTDASGERYYQAITRDLPGGRARFVLIPRQPKEACRQGRPDLVPTFYMIQDKVSLGLFRRFAAAHPELVRSREWEKERDERLPVRNVLVEEAHAFASTGLKGRLPSVEQWDKAAGTSQARRGEGPYRGVWNIEEKPWFAAALFGLTPAPLSPGPVLAASARASWAPPDVACNLRAPRPVGAARDDVSPFGCRDMAGNGQEWTRTLKGGGLEVPVKSPQAFHRVWLRGRAYEADHPLRYDELDDPEQSHLVSCPYLQTDTDIGFRVVIEP